MKVNVLVIVTMVVMVAHFTQSARILMAMPIGPKSHNGFFIPIAEHLALRNHTVTYLSGFETATRVPNLRVVVVPDIDIFKNLPNLFTTSTHTAFSSIYTEMQTVCIKALKYEGVQNLKKEQFDLVMIHAGLTECFLSFSHLYKVPTIFALPNKVVGAVSPATGNPPFPSLSSNFMLDLHYPFTFTGRMISTLYDLMGLISNEMFIIKRQDEDCRALKLCPDDMPGLWELRSNSSLFITNSVKTMENPTLPYTPTVVHAGGIHCRPAQPLPQDLEQWMAASGKSGVIYFSLGTLVKSSTMPEKYLKVLLEVFGSLPQRVLWKWDQDTIEGLPHNVKLSRWLPQQDLLGHPQLRLFITHGGLLSTQEATYHGVPVLGLPVTVDQHPNMRMVQQHGWGRFLNWEDLTVDNLKEHIQDILNNPRFKKEVERRSRVMMDQPVPPGDWVTYWVEYVLRHRGAPHLRSPAMSLPWYQLYNVDVWAVVVVVVLVAVILTTWITYRILRAVVGCCCRSKKTKKD